MMGTCLENMWHTGLELWIKPALTGDISWDLWPTIGALGTGRGLKNVAAMNPPLHSAREIWWCSGFGAFRGPTGTKRLFLTGWAASDGNFHTIAALLAHPQGIKPCRYPDARNRCYTLLAPMDCIAWWQPANHPHHEWLCYESMRQDVYIMW